ncbi:somatostatin-1 [Paralichthys olivaceus]|uniref:somatostatin-1 n=1 Tax=Paralichthys olivaceus TaxID=8255 RepID=UPI003753CB74
MTRRIYQLSASPLKQLNSRTTSSLVAQRSYFVFIPLVWRREGKMLRSQVQVILVALLSSVLLVSGAPRRDMQTSRPRAELTNDKALVHLLLLQFVSELMATRVEQMLPELEEEEEEEEEAAGGRVEVMRRHLPLSQRERKAGCRNFFWKTFTSC